ncbi:MAG: hypothetical protein GY845_09185 [Planctomycetes bacterium]|nr:hypothetical protein [Planctomycetota bacterium]
MDMQIQTDQAIMYSLLRSDLPDGIQIISPPPIEGRAVDWVVHIDIDLSIDVLTVSIPVLLLWLRNSLGRLTGNHKVKVNGKQIPINDPKAEDLIANEVNKQKDG